MNGRIVKIYFSPTGNTKKSVDAMAAALDGDYLDCNVTVDAEPPVRVLTAEDFAIIGAPVYGGRIPKVLRRGFPGPGTLTPCIF
jgi:flavodoxin